MLEMKNNIVYINCKHTHPSPLHMVSSLHVPSFMTLIYTNIIVNTLYALYWLYKLHEQQITFQMQQLHHLVQITTFFKLHYLITQLN